MGDNVNAKEFRFIDGLNHSRDAYNASSRAFVLREFNASRKKRVHAKRRAQQAPHGKHNSYSQSPSDSGEDALAELEIRPSETAKIACLHRPEDALIVAADSPLSLLGQGCVDPFQCFSRPTTHFENQMINVYINHEYAWHYRVDSNKLVPSRDYYAFYNMTDPLLVDVVVSYGARCLAERYQDEDYRKMALVYHTKGLHQIRERLSSKPASIPYTTLVAVGGLVCSLLEPQTAARLRRSQYLGPDVETASLEVHAAGLGNLIKTVGGWRNVAKTEFEPAWLAVWVNCFTSGRVLFGLTDPKIELLGFPTKNNLPDTGNLNPHETLEVYIEELIHSYAEFYRQAVQRRREQDLTTRSCEARHSTPALLFQPETVVGRILRRRDYLCVPRIVPLLLISTVLAKFQSSSDDSLAALTSQYATNLKAVGVEKNPSTEVLSWAVFTNAEERKFIDLDALEWAMRLFFTERQIWDEEIRETLADTLCDFISFHPETDLVGEIKWWTPLEFEKLLPACIRTP